MLDINITQSTVFLNPCGCLPGISGMDGSVCSWNPCIPCQTGSAEPPCATGQTDPTGCTCAGRLVPEPENAYACTLNENASTLDIWSGASGIKAGSVKLGGRPVGIDINQNTKTAYIILDNGSLQVVDLNVKLVTAEISGSFTGRPSVDQSTNMAYAINEDNMQLAVIDCALNTITKQIQVISSIREIAVDSSINRIYALAGEDFLYAFDGETYEMIYSVTVKQAYMIAVNSVTNRVFIIGYNTDEESQSFYGSLITIDGNKGMMITKQPFPGYSSSNVGFAVNSVDNLVIVTTGNSSGGNFIFDGDGHLMRMTGFSMGYFSYDMNNASSNPETGNIYQSARNGGVHVFDKDGNELLLIAAPYSAGVGVTNLNEE